ncbi:hypothetical protein [Burkholderia sp. 3C]
MKNLNFLGFLAVALAVAAGASAITWHMADSTGTKHRLEDFKNGVWVGCTGAPGPVDFVLRDKVCREMASNAHN